MRLRIILLILTCWTTSLAAQPSLSLSDTISKRFEQQLALFPQEKIYVHTDKDCYMAGDTIRFRAFLTDAQSHRTCSKSKYVYVEFLNCQKPASGEQPEPPLRLRILARNGIYHGYIPLPMTAKSGDYNLTAYTAFMQNTGTDYFFRKNIRVGAYASPYVKEDVHTAVMRNFDVQFFPEGGYLIDGVRCRVGFKALKTDGNSIFISGTIYDDTGAQAAQFKTIHAGMGQFYFTPIPGRTYTAECVNEQGDRKRFKLPPANPRTCILQLFPTSERLSVGVAAAAGIPTDDLSLLIHCRGKLCYFEKWNSEKGYLTFERNGFPDGVIQLLLLDSKGKALSERLLFCCNEHDQPRVTVTPDKPRYGRREKVCVDILVRDADGKPLKGTFSLAVTDNRIVDPHRPSDIRTALLLESELRGYIEDPAFYFDLREPDRITAADALMLTQGWRRYDIPATINGKYAIPEYPLEIGQEITGRIRKTGLFRKRNFKGYNVAMIAPKAGIFTQVPVDSTGGFSLNGFDLPDSTICVLRAAGPQDKTDIELLVEPEKFPEILKPLPPSDWETRMRRYNENLTMFTDNLKNILIQEVIISAAPRKLPQTPYEVLAQKSVDYKQIEKEGYSDLRELLLMNGVIETAGKFSFRNEPVIFVIDGVIQDDRKRMFENYESPELKKRSGLRDPWVVTGNSPLNEFDYNAILIESIKLIDIIPPANTVLFGTRAEGSAVVSIKTKDGSEILSKSNDDLDKLNIKIINPIGYQKPVEFYSPKYKTTKQFNNPERDLSGKHGQTDPLATVKPDPLKTV